MNKKKQSSYNDDHIEIIDIDDDVDSSKDKKKSLSLYLLESNKNKKKRKTFSRHFGSDQTIIIPDNDNRKEKKLDDSNNNSMIKQNHNPYSSNFIDFDTTDDLFDSLPLSKRTNNNNTSSNASSISRNNNQIEQEETRPIHSYFNNHLSNRYSNRNNNNNRSLNQRNSHSNQYGLSELEPYHLTPNNFFILRSPYIHNNISNNNNSNIQIYNEGIIYENYSLKKKGLTKEQIDDLPELIYDCKKKSNLLDQSCLICLEEYHEGEILLTLLCFHSFHKQCITKWLEDHQTCPTCRESVIKNVS